MPTEEKPYRVYRGGRVKGKVPTLPKPTREAGRDGRGGVKDANERLPKSARVALQPDDGMMLAHSSNILLLGTDHSLNESRASDQHSDSIMLLRTDPKHHKLIYLSIPRDLRVPNIPGHGPDKINAALILSGPWPGMFGTRRSRGIER